MHFFAPGATALGTGAGASAADGLVAPVSLAAALRATSLNCLVSMDAVDFSFLGSSESDVISCGVCAGVWPGDGWWRGVAEPDGMGDEVAG